MYLRKTSSYVYAWIPGISTVLSNACTNRYLETRVHCAKSTLNWMSEICSVTWRWMKHHLTSQPSTSLLNGIVDVGFRLGLSTLRKCFDVRCKKEVVSDDFILVFVWQHSRKSQPRPLCSWSAVKSKVLSLTQIS